MLYGVYLFLFLVPSACSMKSKSPLPLVPYVDIDRYMGVWYEVASYLNSFQKGCACTKAVYNRMPSGEVRVENDCIKKGKPSKANGVAKVVPNTGNAHLRVQFFWPFSGDYSIIMLDTEYQWAVVGNPSRKYLWILSRDKVLPPTAWGMISKRLPDFGYCIESLQWTEQTNCTP